MVKKRLLFLVLLQVASILVSSQDDLPEPYIVQEVDENVDQFPLEDGYAVEEPPVEEQYPDQPLGEPYPVEDQPLEEPPILIAPPPVEYQQEEEQPQEEIPQEDYIIETFTSRRSGTRKRRRTTTQAPFIPCEELPEVIAIKDEVSQTPWDGYTPDQCVFSIVDQATCEWQYKCGAIITEAPTEPPPPEEEEESAEDEIEECEPKKKFKFENCFLKIRGLIKKKKPRRC